MIEGYDPVTQALLGTLFTWAVTAAGSAVVFFFDANVSHTHTRREGCEMRACQRALSATVMHLTTFTTTSIARRLEITWRCQ
jgi:zinc transporter ZupT